MFALLCFLLILVLLDGLPVESQSNFHHGKFYGTQTQAPERDSLNVSKILHIGNRTSNDVNFTAAGCASKWIKEHPTLLDRFSYDMIAFHCQKSQEWGQMADAISLASADSGITPRQREYLNHLRTCQGLKCFENLSLVCGNCTDNDYVSQHPQGVQIKMKSSLIMEELRILTDEDLSLVNSFNVSNLLTVDLRKNDTDNNKNASLLLHDSVKAQLVLLARVCDQLLINNKNVTLLKEILPINTTATTNQSPEQEQSQQAINKCRNLADELKLSNSSFKQLLLANSNNSDGGNDLEAEILNDNERLSAACVQLLQRNNDPQLLQKQLITVAELCERLRTVASPEKLSWFLKATIGVNNSDGRILNQKFFAWKRKCLELEDRLSVQVPGTNVSSWLRSVDVTKVMEKCTAAFDASTSKAGAPLRIQSNDFQILPAAWNFSTNASNPGQQDSFKALPISKLEEGLVQSLDKTPAVKKRRRKKPKTHRFHAKTTAFPDEACAPVVTLTTNRDEQLPVAIHKRKSPLTNNLITEIVDLRENISAGNLSDKLFANKSEENLTISRLRRAVVAEQLELQTLPDPDYLQLLLESILTNGQQLTDSSQVIDIRARRKELRMLNETELQRFFTAMNQLKRDKIDGISKYDLFVIYHDPSDAPGAHGGAAFLPWHRELLKQLEVALRNIDPMIAIPYWDSSLDEALPNPSDSVLWTSELLGNGNEFVTTGPFANWEATQQLLPGIRRLFRDVGGLPSGGLLRNDDINFALTRSSFGDLTGCIDPRFELTHGLVHMFVGGYMPDLAISPNDPVFFLHHSYIDFIWEEFRQIQQIRSRREVEYPANENACNQFHHGSAQMLPFPLRNIDGLSNNYTDIFYLYEPPPSCSEQKPDCGSRFLFCDKRSTPFYRCLSKIRLRGNCRGFEGIDACYLGNCINGTCVNSTGTEATAATNTTTVVPKIDTTETPASKIASTESPTVRSTSLDVLTTVPSSTRPDSQFVWFTITVIHGNGQPASNGVTITSIGQGNPPDYNDQKPGKTVARTAYPGYAGAALAQVLNPKFSSTGNVNVMVKVSDNSGRECAARCMESPDRYSDCNGTIIVDSAPRTVGRLPYAESEKQALQNVWSTGDERTPDYLLFQCP